MSEPYINNQAHICTCKPSYVTGYINADTEAIHCYRCDGVIKRISKTALGEIANDEINRLIDGVY